MLAIGSSSFPLVMIFFRVVSKDILIFSAKTTRNTQEYAVIMMYKN